MPRHNCGGYDVQALWRQWIPCIEGTDPRRRRNRLQHSGGPHPLYWTCPPPPCPRSRSVGRRRTEVLIRCDIGQVDTRLRRSLPDPPRRLSPRRIRRGEGAPSALHGFRRRPRPETIVGMHRPRTSQATDKAHYNLQAITMLSIAHKIRPKSAPPSCKISLFREVLAYTLDYKPATLGVTAHHTVD